MILLTSFKIFFAPWQAINFNILKFPSWSSIVKDVRTYFKTNTNLIFILDCSLSEMLWTEA